MPGAGGSGKMLAPLRVPTPLSAHPATLPPHPRAPAPAPPPLLSSHPALQPCCTSRTAAEHGTARRAAERRSLRRAGQRAPGSPARQPPAPPVAGGRTPAAMQLPGACALVPARCRPARRAVTPSLAARPPASCATPHRHSCCCRLSAPPRRERVQNAQRLRVARLEPLRQLPRGRQPPRPCTTRRHALPTGPHARARAVLLFSLTRRAPPRRRAVLLLMLRAPRRQRRQRSNRLRMPRS